MLCEPGFGDPGRGLVSVSCGPVCHLIIIKRITDNISANICGMLLFCCLDLIFVHYCVCRKYDQALEYHRQALVLIPQHASTYAAIGYVHSLMGDFESAIDYFHTVKCRFFRLFLICFPRCMCMREVSFRTETNSF